uniref:PB1 domain-containing protein n=1 Tax=Angiostrongylus cantonensis TaxID=6313 RepID=A0A0K0D3S2_ANGCA
MADSDLNLERARFKVYQEFAPRFYIAFKDKDELYRLFRKRIDELGIALNDIYFTNFIGEIEEINDSESLWKIVRNELFAKKHTLRIYVCDDDDTGHSSLDREKRAHRHRHMRRNRQQRSSDCVFCRGQGHCDPRERFSAASHFLHGRVPTLYQQPPFLRNHNCVHSSQFGPFHMDHQFGRYPFSLMGACHGRY